MTPYRPSTPAGPSRPPPIPRLREVRIYFSEKELPAAVATAFFRYYKQTGWLNKAGNPVNWKQAAFRWQLRVYQKQPWLYNRKVR